MRKRSQQRQDVSGLILRPSPEPGLFSFGSTIIIIQLKPARNANIFVSLRIAGASKVIFSYRPSGSQTRVNMFNSGHPERNLN